MQAAGRKRHDPASPLSVNGCPVRPDIMNRAYLLGPLLCALTLPSMVCIAGAQILSVTQVTHAPARFERLEFVVVLKAAWDDPYRSDDIRLDLELSGPSGRPLMVPAYYEDGESGKQSVWHARCAPSETGLYRGRFVLASRAGREATETAPFTVAPSSSRGFLRPAGPWIFRFDTGEPFRGLGENLCWEARYRDDSRFFRALHENPRFNYDYMLGSLSAHGGNFTRVWMCPWNLPLEWKRVSPDTMRYTDSPAHFNPSAIRRMDRFVETAEAAGVYVMLTLDPHGALLGENWARSSYNARNGGPAATPEEFFTNPRARAQYRDRLRYLVARWGYSPRLAVWELFNEVDNAMYGQTPVRIPDDVVTAWHAEMSAYLKGIDPSGRPVTTSISHRDVAGLNRIASIDFNQRHIYRRTDTIPETIAHYVQAEGKPYVIGEFGYEWDWNRNFNEFAGQMDRDFKRGLWLGLFSPTPILPMSWWWEYFDDRGLTAYLARVRAVLDRMLADGAGDFQPIGADEPGILALAVRCGGTTFVYEENDGAAAVSGAPRIVGAPLNAVRETSIFDPETGKSSPGPAVSLHDGWWTTDPLVIQAGQSLVLSVR